MRDTDPEVIPVEAMALPATGLSTATWQWNKIHMEIGISSKENRVCFGDSPHMGALINRAGMGVSIKNEGFYNPEYLNCAYEIIDSTNQFLVCCNYLIYEILGLYQKRVTF